jgi:hypothetical protein
MNEITPIIVAVVMSLPGILSLFIQLKKEKQEIINKQAEKEKEEASATEIIQEAALKMMGIYKAEMETLKERIITLEKRVRELEISLQAEIKEKNSLLSGAWKLYNQIASMNKSPDYTPPKVKG